MPSNFAIIAQGKPTRCDICHKDDLFDYNKLECGRCDKFYQIVEDRVILRVTLVEKQPDINKAKISLYDYGFKIAMSSLSILIAFGISFLVFILPQMLFGCCFSNIEIWLVSVMVSLVFITCLAGSEYIFKGIFCHLFKID